MGLLVSGNITTADGFTLPSIYVSLTSFNFRSSANMPTFASTSSLINAQFNCYKSRDDKIANKLPVQLQGIFTSVMVKNTPIIKDLYAIAYSELSSVLVTAGYTTELILESGQVDGNLYIYNSQGVSRPTS